MHSSKKQIRFFGLLAFVLLFNACANDPYQEDGQSLLWEVSGKNLKAPSYIYGTMHLLCEKDAAISAPFKKILHSNVQQIYFELDMDDMAELFGGGMDALFMNKDTTMDQLLSEAEIQRLSSEWEKVMPLIPWQQAKAYKPMLLAAMMGGQAFECKSQMGMEEAIMTEMLKDEKEIKGLEKTAFQTAIFDSIPYLLQAQQLLAALDSPAKAIAQTRQLINIYKQQNINAIDSLSSAPDNDIPKDYEHLLLQKRNKNWAVQFDTIATKKITLFAVGAAHLPGKEGFLQLLKNKGYTVRALVNK
jgi:uncharacterized protein